MKISAASRLVATLCLIALTAQTCALATGTTSVAVTVNAGTSLGKIPATAYGVNTAIFDGNMFDTQLPSLLKDMGTRAIRYPGGSSSDIYHWQTNSGTTGSGLYCNPSDNFDSFMTGLVEASNAQAIITVNYGSNAAGTAGGDPNEAAAWVQYANVTKKYGVKYWEIGNEMYGNGYYNTGDWETDLHLLDQTVAHRLGNTALSPTTYGTNVKTFVTAMKAKDSTIKVGAVMAVADGSTNATDWNTKALAQCGPNIDFVIMHWYPEYGNDNDANLLADPSSIATYVANMRAQINTYCGTNASKVQIFITETNCDAIWMTGKQTVSMVNGLFAADDVWTWLEQGVANVDWWDLHNGVETNGDNGASLYGNTTWGDFGLLSAGQSPEPAAETPFPPYMGLMMLGFLGGTGDTMVSTSSNSALLKTHAVLQSNGSLAIMLINEDPNNTASATVTLNGYTATGSDALYEYKPGFATGGASANVVTGLGSLSGGSFSGTVDPYSVTIVVLGGSVPDFSTSASAPSGQLPSTPIAIKATLTDEGAAVTACNVEINIVEFHGSLVGTKTFTGESFTAGQKKTLTFNTTTSSNSAKYVVEISVFNANNTLNYASNSNAGTLTVVGNAPSGLSATAGAGSVTLKWTAVAGAGSYNIYRATTSGGEGAVPLVKDIISATYTNTGLTGGTKYFYQVTANSQGGESPKSSEVSATPFLSEASFVSADTVTQGSWKGTYGGDGWNVIGDTSSNNPKYPSYATVTASGNSVATWTSASTAASALQQSAVGSYGRMLGVWYASSSFTVDVNLTDGNTHQVALYFLDWAAAGRAESVTISDATGNVLGTWYVRSFSAGLYDIWNITGHVKITITKTTGANCVLSGIFFGPATGSTAPAAPSGLAGTAGAAQVALAWSTTTGAASYNVYRGTISGGEGATPLKTGLTTAMYTDTGLTPGTKYYYQIMAVNAVGGSPASTEASAVPTATATFVATDTTTQGNWQGKYGTDGYNVFGDTTTSPTYPTDPKYPGYATVTPSGELAATWSAASTANLSKTYELEDLAGTGRVAGVWYASSSFSVDVDVTGGSARPVSLYFLDWAPGGRAETVTITDAGTGAVLDTRSVSSFAGGIYDQWNVNGSVKFTITKTAGPNAVLTGLFFK